MTDSLTISLTRMVIEKFAPEELPMLDQKGFPEIGEGKVGSGPMGIGLDVALLFLAPFVYAFFEALVKEAGKSATSEIVSLLKSSSDGSETREKIAEYLIAKGFEPEVSNSVAKDILKIAKEH